MTLGFVSAGDFAPTFEEPNLWRSLHVKSHRKLAKSNPFYENVGYLKGWNQDERENSGGKSQFVCGNAVYISERMCLTAAHLLKDNFKYEIEFTFHTGKRKTYKVQSFVLHEKYASEFASEVTLFSERPSAVHSYKQFSVDIAILILSEDVKELKALPIPSIEEYNLVAPTRYMNVQTAPKLLTVGYGPDYMWDGFIRGPNPKDRKAFWLVVRECVENVFVSFPCGLEGDLKTTRQYLPFEGQASVGYCGAAMIDPQHGLVGLMVGTGVAKENAIAAPGVTVRKDWMRDVNNTRLSARTMWVLLAIGYYMIPVYSFFYNIMKYFDVEEYMPNHTWFTKPCGAMTAVMLLQGHKEWIEKIRREEIGSDV